MNPVVIKWTLQAGSELYFAGFTPSGVTTWVLDPDHACWLDTDIANRMIKAILILEGNSNVEVEEVNGI